MCTYTHRYTHNADATRAIASLSIKWDVGSSSAALYENEARANTNTNTSSSATKSYNYRAYDHDSSSGAGGNERATCPQSVALASAFKKRSLERWEAAKKLRSDPILPEFERLALESAQQKQTNDSSAMAAAAFTSFAGSGGSTGVSADAATVDGFRRRSKQSWLKQSEELRSEAAEIGFETATSDRQSSTADKDSDDASSSSSSLRSRESLAVQLHRRGYGLSSSTSSQKTGAKAVQGSVENSSTIAPSNAFRDASRDAWQATKALRSELPSDVFAGTGTSNFTTLPCSCEPSPLFTDQNP